MVDNENGSANTSDDDVVKNEMGSSAAVSKRSMAGLKMAAALAEAVLMRYFFPDTKDRRKQ
jgi:hypothetical protein